MNPPFSRQQDVDHVLHALKFLKPGGTLVSVMSASVCFRTNRKTPDFWEVLKRQHSYQRQDNPENSFAESGTQINTCTVVVQTKG